MRLGSKPGMGHSLLWIKSVDMQDPHLLDDSAFSQTHQPLKIHREKAVTEGAETVAHLSRHQRRTSVLPADVFRQGAGPAARPSQPRAVPSGQAPPRTPALPSSSRR